MGKYKLKKIGIILVSFLVLGQVNSYGESGIIKHQARDKFTSSKNTKNQYHFFAGEEISLPITIDVEENNIIDLKVETSQKAFSMEAPHQLNVRVQNIDDSKRTVSITLPEVQREVTYVVRFFAKFQEEGTWKPVGELEVIIYPKNLLAPLIPWSKSVDLHVKDSSGVLVGFLEKKDISFSDYLNQEVSVEGTLSVTFIVNDSEKEVVPSQKLGKFETIVIFNTQRNTLPKVVSKSDSKGRIIKVDLDLIEYLDSDPRAQKAFLEIIRLIY